MRCSFCGEELSDGQRQCPRCGLELLEESGPEADVFSSAQDVAAPDIASSSTAGSSQVPASADPQAELKTQLVSLGDRQEVIETKLVEMAPPAASPPPPERRGLPDSRVARGVEDGLIDVKRFLYRLGRVGRFAFFAHVLVIVGAVSPWIYVPHQGYTPGVETWGAASIGLAALGMALLWWRFKRVTGAKAAPVLLHLLLAAGLVLFLAWRYQEIRLTAPHLGMRPAFGFYVSALGASLSLVGALLNLKNLR